MPWPRLLILFLGLAIILGLMLWLVSSLQWLYVQIALSSPFLANLLLFCLIALIAVLIGAFLYYGWMFRGQKQSKQPHRPHVPEDKVDAAATNLRAVHRQVQQIQDEVTRQALLQQTRRIAKTFTRRELRIVVFGTGSAGKTSLVNVMMGQMVGTVGATMGTTGVGQTFRCQLRGVDQQLWITDTPGLSEPGIAGTDREQAARKLATEADLLLFVIDGDLTQSEYQPLQALGRMGKRSLLVFNKTDCYPSADQTLIQQRLQERVQGWIPPEDIVAIAAHPQPLKLATGNTVQPDPDIQALLQRIVRILREEGDDLFADNILLQSQRLGTEARQQIDQERRQQADQIVERFQWIGAGVIWVTPVPVIDLLATAAVNTQMVIEIAKIYGCDLTLDRAKDLALSLAKTMVSLGIVKGAIEVFSRALQFSVAGFVVGKTIQSIGAAYLTRIAGKSFIEYFRNDQDWGDGGMTEVVQRQFQLHRRDHFVKAFIQDAITKLPSEFGRRIQRQLSPTRPLVEEEK
ncbi:YcjF family protein [Acaryochloris sp. IP29b_bin.148]|uniref:YcjF family protein n=1 Tax=Acaryochloris sp. IP29b_bin.148 TaxID=2969218 RepID=UPI0026080FA1|nr:GTP-binding protein [Acaryochloris sp. IP29b_bin.148]